jgi:PKD repeat protein
LRCSSSGTECASIAGAIAQSYVPVAPDVGRKLEVQEIARNAGGASSPAASSATAVVVPPVPVNTGVPKISGPPRQGATLTEEHGSWTNSPTHYEVQWLQCSSLGAGCLPISGATEQAYVPAAADVGHTLAVEEVAINAGGSGAPVISMATAVVLSSVPVNVKPPSISGTAENGQTLVEQHGTWTNEPTGYTYEWLQCSKEGTECKTIAGAVDQTYLATAIDVGHTLKVNEVASNGGAQSSTATSAPSALVQPVPLHAVAGENVSATAGVSVSFDGSGSSPSSEIGKYQWEFGDGSEGKGQSISHVYAAAGIYTAKLTISRGVENMSASVTVTVASAPTHTASIEVTDSGHSPLSGATVLYIGPRNVRIQAVTGSDGKASLPGLPDGSDTVYAYRSGFQPTAGQVTVSGGAGEATIALSSGEIATSTLKAHEMTLKEIEAAGINVNDPANQNVYEFEVRLAFIESPQEPVGFRCYINSHGEFVGGCTGGAGGGGWGGGGGPSCSPHECVGGGIVAVPEIVEGKPLIQWLILRGKASVLKQFFEVSEVVQNLSPEPFKLAAGTATLNVPPGMSLAPTATPQSATQNVAAIPGNGSAETNWIVRGDKPGEYFLSSNYHSKLEPFEAPVELEARLASPLKVWGVEALSLTVQADEGFLAEGRPYHVRIGVTNKANIPLYNVNAEILLNIHERFIFQPDQEASHLVSELKPDETVYAPKDILVPDAASEAPFNPALSSAHFVGEEIHPGVGIQAVVPPPLYTLSGPADTPNMVHLHWQSVPGAEGYEVFSIPNLDTPFSEAPDSVLSSPSGEEPLTKLPSTATNAYIFGSSTETPKYYAVSSIIDGTPTLEFPVIPATAGAEPPASSGGNGSAQGGVLGYKESSPGSENGLGAPAPTCPKHSVALAGGITVQASCFGGSGGKLTATGRIRVNGLDIVLASGTFTLDTQRLALSASGQVDVYAGSEHLYHGDLAWDFQAKLSLHVPAGVKIKGLSIEGEIVFSLVPGGVDAVANATIGNSLYKVSGQIDLQVTLSAGLKLNSLELELASDVPIKSLVVKKAKLAYHHTSAGDVWDGVVAVELPAKGPTVQGELVLTNGSVSEVALKVSGINKPIGEVVFLQSLGLKVDFIPRLSATGSIGLSAGPNILGHTAASLNGSLTATIGDPFVLEAAGTLDMIDQKVASASVKATIPGGVSFSGEISRSFAVIEITGGISGSITPQSFEAQGHVKIDAHVVSASGDALVNNAGLAGCASAQVLWATVSIGASHRWSGENSVFADTCGFGRLQSALGASSSALSGPPTIVHVPPHTRQINLVVRGTNASPEIALTQGRNHLLIMPNTTGAFGRAVYLALADPSIDATYIAIAGPEAGTLDVASTAGQPRFASVGSALPLPSPHVRISVHSVGTRRYRLSWSSRKIPGQTLLFQDVNARGRVQVLSTTRSAGRITFAALDNGASGPHRLRVVVEQDGLIRESLAGLTFHPAPVRVGRPRVNVRSTGRTDVITWSAARNATSYDVSVSISDGRHLFFAVGARKRAVRIQGAPNVVANVRAVGTGMEVGPLGVGRTTTSHKTKPKNHA